MSVTPLEPRPPSMAAWAEHRERGDTGRWRGSQIFSLLLVVSVLNIFRVFNSLRCAVSRRMGMPTATGCGGLDRLRGHDSPWGRVCCRANGLMCLNMLQRGRRRQ